MSPFREDRVSFGSGRAPSSMGAASAQKKLSEKAAARRDVTPWLGSSVRMFTEPFSRYSSVIVPSYTSASMICWAC